MTTNPRITYFFFTILDNRPAKKECIGYGCSRRREHEIEIILLNGDLDTLLIRVIALFVDQDRTDARLKGKTFNPIIDCFPPPDLHYMRVQECLAAIGNLTFQESYIIARTLET